MSDPVRIIAYRKENSNFAHLHNQGIIRTREAPGIANTSSGENKVDQTLIWIILIVILIAMLFWPQWQARRRREKQMAAMRVGSQVMTVGGIIGKLTYINTQENRARIEIAPGVEIQVVVNAIGQVLEPAPNNTTISSDEDEEVKAALAE